MKVNVSGKGIKIGDHLKERVETKLKKYDRYFDDDATATVKVRPEGEQKCVEITIKIKGHFYRAETVADDEFTALDLCIDVMERQIRKHKTRLEKNIHDYAYLQEYLKTQAPLLEPADEETPEGRLIRKKSFDISPMSADEACLQMEMLGHSFLLFLSEEGDRVCLVYKRKDGNYGLIEPNY